MDRAGLLLRNGVDVFVLASLDDSGESIATVNSEARVEAIVNSIVQ